MRIALAQINPLVGDIDGNERLVRERLVEAREAGAQIVLFPELTLTGYPPEDLLLKEHLLADVAAGPRAPRAATRRASSRSSASPSASGTSTTPPPCSPTARSRRLPQAPPAQLRRVRRAALLPARARRRRHRRRRRHASASRSARTSGYPGPARERRGAGRRAADRQHLRLALPRRQGRAPRAHARPARPATSSARRVLQPGRRAGRARLRRALVRRRPARRGARPRRPSSRRSCVADIDLDAAVRRAPARHPSARRRALRGRAAAVGRARPRSARPRAGVRGRPAERGASRRCSDPPTPRSTPRSCSARATTCDKNGFEHVVLGLSGGIDSALVACVAVDALGPDARDVRLDAVALLLRRARVADAGAIARRTSASTLLELPIGDVMDAYEAHARRRRSRAASPTSPRRTCRRASAATC